MSKKITLSMLRKAGACKQQLDAFEQLFPRGVEVTIALCREHVATFNWGWAAENLLSPSARAAYDEARTTAGETYLKAEATAAATHGKTIVSAWAKEYLADPLAARDRVATTLATYKEAVAAALADYDEAVAVAWAEAYLGQGVGGMIALDTD